MQLKAAIAASLQEQVKSDIIPQTTNTIEVEDSDLETFDSDNEEKHDSTPAVIASKSLIKAEEPTISPETVSKTEIEKVNQEIEDYRLYLGPENGSKFELIVRYPDGNRENITFPSDSQLKVFIE